MASKGQANTEATANKKHKDTERSEKPVAERTRPGGGTRLYGRNATMPVMMADKYAEVVLPEIPMFNPDDIKLDATIVAIGKRRTGKSWIFRNLMYLFRKKIPAGIVISQTDHLNHFWRQYIPSKYIYPKYDPAILEAVFQRQSKILNDPVLTEAEKDKLAPFFVLLDDVISDDQIRHDPFITELFVAGRHYRLFVLITTQYAKAINTRLRGNTDYCFMMKCTQGLQREAMWEDFADFLTKDAFNQILDEYTEDNEVLVINTCPENNVRPEDMMCWWKACDPGPFKMGSKKYWESAIFQNQFIPPHERSTNTFDLLSVDEILPAPYDRL